MVNCLCFIEYESPAVDSNVVEKPFEARSEPDVGIYCGLYRQQVQQADVVDFSDFTVDEDLDVIMQIR